jgi:hypothetical protein
MVGRLPKRPLRRRDKGGLLIARIFLRHGFSVGICAARRNATAVEP